MFIRVPIGGCSLNAESVKVFAGDINNLSAPAFVSKSTPSTINQSLLSVAPINPGTNDLSCMTNPNFESCIFYKNPVAQQGKIFNPQLTLSTDLSTIQTYGVNLNISGQTLDNNNFSVCGDRDGTYKRFIKNSNWKISYINSRTNRELEQVMAFYWLNNQISFFKQWTGNFYAAEKKIQVFAYNPMYGGEVLDNAFWDSDLNSIVMGRSESLPAVSYGLAAEIYAHEMGHADLEYASPSSSIESNYCADSKGCFGGIHEGQADYHAALMFGPGPVGESILNDLNGLSGGPCVIDRNILKNSTLMAAKAFKPGNCSYSDGTPAENGEVHDMGALYASMWWEVRRKSGATPGKSSRELDQLFMEHLAALQTSDTFVTALCKISNIDKAIFGNRYSQFFSDEYIKRGLPGLESCK